MNNDPLIPTAERALRLAELLLQRPEGWTPQELLLELDLSRSALFVLLRGLKGLGYVEQPGRRGRYTAGARLVGLRAPRAPSHDDLLTAFFQEAEQALSGMQPRETLALVTPAPGGGAQVLAQVESSAPVRASLNSGQVLIDTPAAALALETTPPARVREAGYALETAGEILALALPICRDGRTPEAALLLAAPAHRWTAAALLNAALEDLRRMAARLSYRLGAPLYTPYRDLPPGALQETAALDPGAIGEFLRGPHAARLACVRPDGRPHVIPVWQEWDGESFTVIAWRGSQWADYVLANPNVSLTVDEPWAPLRRVVVSGCARPVDLSTEAMERLLARMARRYLGRASSTGLGRQALRAFSIQPEALRGWQGLLQGER